MTSKGTNTYRASTIKASDLWVDCQVPVEYVQIKLTMWQKTKINNYTAEGKATTLMSSNVKTQ